jgi:hypothetical protein
MSNDNLFPIQTRIQFHKSKDILKQAPGQKRQAEWVAKLFNFFGELIATRRGNTRKEAKSKIMPLQKQYRQQVRDENDTYRRKPADKHPWNEWVKPIAFA